MLSKEEFERKLYDIYGTEYQVLEYENTQKKAIFKHSCGRTFTAIAKDMLRKDGRSRKCPCMSKFDIDFIKRRIYSEVQDEYTLLSIKSDKKSKHTYLQLKHNTCGNIFFIRFDLFFNGSRCPECHKSGSNEEKDLNSFIKSIYSGTIIENDRTVIKNKEIDIYLPDLKLGFEFDGIYWHSKKFKKSNYHSEKTDLFYEKGINIVHIFEDDWRDRNEQTKNIIRGLFNKVNSYDSRMICKEIAKEYLNDHSFNNKTYDINIGCYNNNKLISVLSFEKKNDKLILKNQGNSAVINFNNVFEFLGENIEACVVDNYLNKEKFSFNYEKKMAPRCYNNVYRTSMLKYIYQK